MASDPSNSKARSAGWNDPPMFTYESRVQGIQGAKLNLTKRVSFPLSSGSLTSSQPFPLSGGPPILPPSANVPPIPSGSPGLKPPVSTLLDISQPSITQPNEDNSDIQFQQVYKNLEPQIEDISKVNERAANDIKKKIQLLEMMWNENKFSLPLKSRILDLSKVIMDKDLKSGDEIQRSLMVDHAALCGSWISALRHLLNTLISDPEEKTS